MIRDRKGHGIVALCLALLIMALGVMTASAAPTCTTTCYVDAVNGDDTNDGTTAGTALKTIQAAIDTVQAGGQVRVLPGSYDETATNRDVLGGGNYQFGLFFEETAKDGVTLMGVTAADVEITDPALVEADITTNATNNFGTSGIFVEADDVTISGLEIGPNTPGENKTIEIIGNNFTLKNSFVSGDGIDGGYPYVDDWRYDDVNDVAYVTEYTFDNNIFGAGSQIAISSGAGGSGPASGRQITNNEFTMGAGQNWPSISFNGKGGVAWFTYPVGGAIITGNTFNNDSYGAEQWIRARGEYIEAQFDWASYWNDNTYDNATVAYQTSLADPRPYAYSTFTNVRRIGAQIQSEIDTVAQAGDTVLVNEGTYPESPTIDKSLTLLSDDGRDVTFIELQTGTNYTHSLLISGAEVTVDGFTVVGIDGVCPTLASTNIYVDKQTDNVVIKNNRIQVGAIDGCSNGDDGIGIITLFTANPDINSLLVEDNIFEPLNAAGQRAYYINPSVVDFTARGNVINGQFNGTAASEAQDNLIENNTINGTGTSGGFVLAGYADPTVWGHGTIQNNTILDTLTGVIIVDTQDVLVTKNFITDTDRGVRVIFSSNPNFDESTIHINRNAITGSTTFGIQNQLDQNTYGDIDGTCNWWGDASGPGPVGPGSGDNVSADVVFSPWLYSDNLDGPCFVGGTITIQKVAAGGAQTEFEFDVSWSATNVVLNGGESETSDPLPADDYSVSEVNLPAGWSLDSAGCINEAQGNPPVVPIDPSSIPVADNDHWVCMFTNVYTPPPANVCPVEDAGHLYTDIIGMGMGSTKKHKTQLKLNVPNWTNVDTLYGQLVAKDSGAANYVRFILPGKNNFVQVNTITSPLEHSGGNFWYGAYLPPSQWVKARWFLQKSGVKGHLPRAFVLYPTYEDPIKTYVNVWDTYDAAEGEVYWDTAHGWTPYREIIVPIAPPNGPTTFHVELAVADNDKDSRRVWVTVTAGGVTQTVSPNNPDHGDQLNLLTFDLPNVPAGTDEIVIEIASYNGDGVIGDSATLVGMAANYACAPLNN
ncbi:MAG: hypothetical protein KA170_01920 [Candidatus Promineofilum sp.]|nr:hypothetical protein [Promineifilum sp.]